MHSYNTQLDNYPLWFNGKPEYRILNWRETRNKLKDWPSDLDTIAQLWAKAPLYNQYLDSENVDLWPDPWQLISQGRYCNFAVSLGMLYTIFYTDYPYKDSMVLQGFRLKNDHNDINLLVCEQGKYVLNYNIGSVVNIQAVADTATPIYSISIHNIKF